MSSLIPSPIQTVHFSPVAGARVALDIKRDDLLHPSLIGNKYRKSLPLLAKALTQGVSLIVTVGGAYSNHLLAISAAGREIGISTLGLVRGEEAETRPTELLRLCQANGMRIKAVSRDTYYAIQQDEKSIIAAIEGLESDFFYIPEGGTDPDALRSVAGLVSEIPNLSEYDYIACPVGTGGTALGIAFGLENSAKARNVRILALSALKGYQSMPQQGVHAASQLGSAELTQRLLSRILFVGDTAGRGFGKATPELLEFMRSWQDQTEIPLDYVYTGKAIKWIVEQSGAMLAGKRVLFIHTGGYQTAGLDSESLRPTHLAADVSRLKPKSP